MKELNGLQYTQLSSPLTLVRFCSSTLLESNKFCLSCDEGEFKIILLSFEITWLQQTEESFNFYWLVVKKKKLSEGGQVQCSDHAEIYLAKSH